MRIQATILYLLVLQLTACGGGGGGGESETKSFAPAPITTPINTVNPSTSTANNTTLSNGSVETPPVTQVSNQLSTKTPALGDITLELGGTKTPKLPLEVTELSLAGANGWIELYNPNTEDVDLSSYQIRTIATTDNIFTSKDVVFNLPNVKFKANSYLIAARNQQKQGIQNQQDVVYLKQNEWLPYIDATGFIELIHAQQTVSMLRFKPSYEAVTKTGSTIVNMHNLNIADLYRSTSIALYKNQWQSMNFATPAAKNDVAPNTLSSDGDGIPDSAKEAGNTYGGIDLYAMGARKGRKDVFIHVDYMTQQDNHVPQKLALDKVKQSFAKQNIALHINVGNLYGNGVENYNLDGLSHAKSYAECSYLSTFYAKENCKDLLDTKYGISMMNRSVFFYSLFANSQQVGGSKGSSGIAEFKGKNSLITLGNWYFSNKEQLINMQASSLMHEIGHNFGLLHGGHDNLSHKPNYLSVMNYLYQLRGLPATNNLGFNIGERYNAWRQSVNHCSLNFSACSNDFILDYSHGKQTDLDEAHLNETEQDWNQDGHKHDDVAFDVNQDNTKTVLKDHNDWQALTFLAVPGVKDVYAGSSDIKNSLTTKIVSHELNNHAQNIIKETH